MKKILSSVVALVFACTAMAQTIVSTSPENRNAILEEFTGVNCQYCPDGHRLANQACAAHPGHAWSINIHTGTYAARYFTQWGAAIANQAGIQGYPAGSVNRHNFGNGQLGGTAMSRGSFASAVNQICNTPSPVNVAAEGTIVGRELTLHIEVYYTADASNSTNLLNVAMLQNNVIGPQVGASYNPNYVVGSQYRHMHMLRELLTGQWGITIPATQGTFFDTTIVYQIPQAITGTAGNVTSTVEIGEKFSDLEFIVFVAESHQEILSGTKADITLFDPNMTEFTYEQNDCSFEYQPYVAITNATTKTVTDLTFTYDGQTIVSHKVLAPGDNDTIHMPSYTIVPNNDAVQNYVATKSVTFDSYVDTDDGSTVDLYGSAQSITMADFNIYTVEGPLHLDLATDRYASETTVEFYRLDNCTRVWSCGPFANLSANGTVHHWYSLSPADPGIYLFSVNDAWGDGMGFGSPTDRAGFKLSNANGVVFSAYGNFGSRAFCYLNITNAGDGNYLGINDAANVAFDIYPNPVADRLTVSCSQAIRTVEILDVAGRTIMTVADNSGTISTANLPVGVYMLRVVTDAGVSVKKFVKE